MHGQWIGIPGWSRAVANRFHVTGPADSEGLSAPHLLRQAPIGTFRQSVHNTSRIDHSHLIRIERRSLRLLGERAVQTESRGAHVPKGPADQIALERVVVQYGRVAGVAMSLGIPVAEARTNGARIRDGSLVQHAHRS